MEKKEEKWNEVGVDEIKGRGGDEGKVDGEDEYEGERRSGLRVEWRRWIKCGASGEETIA